MKMLNHYLTGLDRANEAYCVTIEFRDGGILAEYDVLGHDDRELRVVPSNGDPTQSQFVQLRHCRKVTVIEL